MRKSEHMHDEQMLRPGVRPAPTRMLAAAAVMLAGFVLIVISAATGVLLA